MKYNVVLIAMLAFAGCGSSSHDAGSTQKTRFKLVVSDTPIVLQAGHSLALQLLVVGAGSDEATISSPDLPQFATLQGGLLTLSPGREYEGDYDLTLVAEAAASTASAVLHVTVTRHNTPPAIEGGTFMGDASGLADSFCASFGTCTLHGVASIYVNVKDAEGDLVTVDVEVVQSGQAFSGIPTHSVTAPVGVDHADGSCGSAYDAFHACIQVPLRDLATGRGYAFAIRLRDALGATATYACPYPTLNEWLRSPGFRFILETP